VTRAKNLHHRLNLWAGDLGAYITARIQAGDLEERLGRMKATQALEHVEGLLGVVDELGDSETASQGDLAHGLRPTPRPRRTA